MATAPKKLYKFGNDTIPFDTDAEAIQYAEENGLNEFTPLGDAPTSASLAPEQPTMLPKLSGRFFTKEAQAAKLDPTGGKRKQMQAAYQADLARWKSLPDDQKMGSFDQWVETVYAHRTQAEAARARKANPNSKLEGREAPGVGKGLFRRFSNITAAKGEDRGAMPVSPLLQVAFTGVGNLPQKLNEAAYRVAGGQSQEDRDIANYMRLRTPIEKRGLVQGAKDLGAAAYNSPLATIREMFNPDDIGVNGLSMVPVAGEAGLGTKVARLMTSAPGKVAAKVIASAPAELAASAAVGGGLNAVAGDEGVGTDFLMGAVPGVTMGLSGMAGRKLAGAASDALANRVSRGTSAVEPHHVDASIRKRIIEKAATPDEIGEPTAQDIFTNPDVIDFARRSKNDLAPRDIEVLKRLGAIVYPGFEAFSESDQIDKIRGAIVAGANAAKEAENAAPTPLDQTSIEKLAQVLPTERGVLEHTELLPANSRAKYLNQAYSAYQTLRKNDPNFRVIPELEKPSFADVSGNFLESQQKKAAALAEEAKSARKAATDAKTEEKASREQAATLAEARSIEAQTSLDNLTAALGLERDANNLHHTLKTSAALGTIKDDLLELDPKQLRLLLSQPDRYAEIRPDLEKAVTPGMLKMLEDANAGGVDDATFAKISKKVLGARQEDLQATTAGQQATMDNAKAAQGIREGVAQIEERASVAEQEAAERQAKAEADAQEREDHFFATSDEGAMNLLMEEIKQNPEKAMLLLDEGRGAKLAKSLGSDKAHFASDAKKELVPLLIDQVRKIRSGERSLPKGFF